MIATGQATLLPPNLPPIRVFKPSKITTGLQRYTNSAKNAFNENLEENTFLEQFMKLRFRDFKNNTRFDIKNADLKNQQIKRSRMIQYSHAQQRIQYSNVLMQS